MRTIHRFALGVAKVNAAGLLGLSDEIGTIEPGKRADRIAVDGDPREDVSRVRRVRRVMRHGVAFTSAP